MKFKEFEASTHMAMSSDDIYRIASDPNRIGRWIPSDLAPSTGDDTSTTSTTAAAAKARATGTAKGSRGMSGNSQRGGGGIHSDPSMHRLEWSTSKDGCETWLQVREASGESDVTIHLSVPETQARDARLQQRLEQALQQLEIEANRGLNV